MMREREIVPDWRQHVPGEREVVDWDRPDGKTYRNVPIYYIREVTAEDYYEIFPEMRGKLDERERYFWEVRTD